MKPLIRDMRESDIATIVANDERILGQSLGEETLRIELVENRFTKFFVMVDEETGFFLGHVGLWIDIPLASILNFYVIPEYQRQGLGTSLLNFTINHLKEKKVNTLTLEVRKSNEVAVKMYQRFGFSAVSVRKNYYADGEDAFLMLKNIELEK